jgi:hypothetical protein
MRLRRATRKDTRRRGSQQPVPRGAVVIMALCVVAGVGFVVARIQRHDAFVAWRQSLEEGGRIEWPPWDPAWPKLPVRASTRRRPIDVTGAAAFAVRNAEVMQHVPCYCGACPPDHGSNLSCYVTGFQSDGSPMWTDHASTCPICVNVTREVMLMVRQGRSLKQIRDTLDFEYTRAGHHPSTQTPHPPASN